MKEQLTEHTIYTSNSFFLIMSGKVCTTTVNLYMKYSHLPIVLFYITAFTILAKHTRGFQQLY